MRIADECFVSINLLDLRLAIINERIGFFLCLELTSEATGVLRGKNMRSFAPHGVWIIDFN